MSSLEIHTLNVGQGDAAFIAIKDDKDNITDLILVDAGPATTIANVTINAYWGCKFRMAALKMIIISHWDADHCAGLQDLQNMFFSGLKVYAPRAPQRITTSPKCRPLQFNRLSGLRLPLPMWLNNEDKSISLTCYGNEDHLIKFPAIKSAPEMVSVTEKNVSSLIFLVKYENREGETFRYYTAGDLDQVNESKLVGNLAVGTKYLTSMKVSHHGSETSTPPDFLERTKPKIAIFSFGEGNSYRHPHPDVVGRVVDNGTVPIFTNDPGFQCDYGLVSKGRSIIQRIDKTTCTVSLSVAPESILPGNQTLDIPSILATIKTDTVEESPASANAAPLDGNKLSDFMSQYFHDSELTYAKDGNSCTIADLRIYGNCDCMFETCTFSIDSDDKITCEALWQVVPSTQDTAGQVITLRGEASSEGEITLSSQDCNQAIPLIKAMELMDSTAGNIFTYLPQKLLNEVKIKISSVEAVMRRAGTQKGHSIMISTTADYSVDISKTIKIENPTISILNSSMSTSGQNYYQCIAVVAGFIITLDKVDLGLYMSFNSSHVWSIYIRPKNLTLIHLAELIPGFNKTVRVEDWFSTMGQSLSITEAVINISISPEIAVLSLEFKFAITLLGMSMDLMWTHYTDKNMGDTVSGQTTKGICLYELLGKFGVSEEHASFLPDIELSSLYFSATPGQDSYCLSSSFTFEDDKQTISVGKFPLTIDNIYVEINSTSGSAAIDFSISGTINETTVTLEASYNKDSGFVLEGSFYHISIADLLNPILHIEIENTCIKRINAEFDKIQFKVNESGMDFEAALPELGLCNQVTLKNNDIKIEVEKTNISLGLKTNVIVKTSSGRSVDVKGTMYITPESLNLLVHTNNSFNDILGVQGLNIGDLTLAISENLTPPGLGVGMLGELEYKENGLDLKGDMAIYLSEGADDKELVAINFNGISMLNIASMFVHRSDKDLPAVLGEIALEPITISSQQGTTQDLDDTALLDMIEKYENSTSGSYEVLSHKTYNWVDEGTRVIKNKTNFKTYEFSQKDVTLRKYVGMYACLDADGSGITIYDNTFRSGFAFCAQLEMFGATATVDFTAEADRGIKLYAEINNAITLGKLSITRVEDSSKGPILSLCTYPECFAIYFSAKIKVASIFEEQVRVLFANDQFAFMLKREVLGFVSTIEASGEVKNLKTASFSLALSFDTNGFSSVTNDISSFLHEQAQKIYDATSDASQKLEQAKQKLNEHQSDLNSTQNKINNINSSIAQLKGTHYPWYKAYKYVALGVTIAAKEAEVGVLSACKLSLLALIEVAKGILTLAEKTMDEAGKLSAETLELIGDVTAIAGKTIDWLIRLDHIEAAVDLSAESLDYHFDVKYQLCGKSHEKSLELDLNAKNLAEELVALIKGSNQILDDAALTLENIYGQGVADDVAVNLEDVRKVFSENVALADKNVQIFGALSNDMAVLNEILSCKGDSPNTAHYSQSIPAAQAKRLNRALNKAALSCQSLSNLNAAIKDDDYSRLEAGLSRLSGQQVSISRTDISADQLSDYQTMHTNIGAFAADIHNVFMVNSDDKADDNAILSDEYSLDLIDRYQLIIDDERISDYLRTIFSDNLARAQRQRGERTTK